MKDKIIVITLLTLFINQFIKRPMNIVVDIIGFTYVLPDIKRLFKYNRVDVSRFIENFVIRVVAILSVFCNIMAILYVLENDNSNILRKLYKYEIFETEAILITAILSFLVMFIMEVKFIYKIEKNKIIFIWIPAVLTIIYLIMYFNIISASCIVYISYAGPAMRFSSKLFLIIIVIMSLMIWLPKFIKAIYSFRNKRK